MGRIIEPNYPYHHELYGLTTRAYIATQIMASFYAEGTDEVTYVDGYNKTCAKWAISAAEELIRQLNEKQDDEYESMKGINI